MTDNTAHKTHLRDAYNTLNNLGNIDAIASIVAKQSLDLFSILNTKKELYIDDEIRQDINNIRTRLQAGGLAGEATTEIANLNAEEAALPAAASAATRRAEIGRERSKLVRLTGGTHTAPGTGSAHVVARRDEYTRLHTHANYFNTTSKIKNIDINLSTPIAGRGGIADINQFLDFRAAPAFEGFKTAVGNPPANYTLCDEEGVPLPQPTPGNYTVQIGGQTATISGITLAGRRLDLRGITVSPSNVDISQALKLSINATYPSTTIGVNNINMTCNKKFELQLRRGVAPTPVNTTALRQTEIDNYDTTAPGHIVTNELTSLYANKFPTLQREAVFEALKHMDPTRFGELEAYGKKNGKEEEIKEELYQQIYRNFLNVGAIAGSLDDINDYNNFSDWFADDARNRNTDPAVIASNVTYQSYVHANLNRGVQDYMNAQLKNLLSDNHINNIRLKTELSSFLTHIENRKNDEERVGGRYINGAVETDIGKNDLMRTRGKRKDENYMRFYKGASEDTSGQTVDISTNTRIIDFKNVEPIKYDMSTTISEKNQISVTIKFPNTDKRYPRKEIILKGSEIATLSRKILNCPDIRDLKVRAHIVYNMVASMVKISAKKNLSLRYRVPGTSNQREIIMNGKNITLYERNDVGGTRTENILFDYDSFLATNAFHGLGDSRSLETAIDQLMGHFNYAMNEYHEQYKNATRSRLLKTKVSANGFRTSPLKTIMNLKGTRNFNFTTSATNEDGKQSVNINFENNITTLKIGEIEVKGNDLGKLLETRKNKIRIFDGVERNVVFAFYDELVKQLRQNAKIERSNFAVRDTLTQNIYVMDEDGELGIISPEDPGDILGRTALKRNRNARIIPKADLDAVDARGGRRICTAQETKEAFMNPEIMGRMIKVMNKRMKHF